ncbi:hypothetical protein CAEBREN_13996 [Caenorhabditis brenneri]|uniref:Serpentine Receptor, class H n=1 Tax=Caenorhabditis brenneri TaxID=135651 RepID=G0N159_CAEBE|nr:hypothetical protein CAEBREN_13996 [Caenorhabditis brenneri]
MSCLYRNSYLESDQFYVAFLHILSIVQVPLLIFGIYIIQSKSPKNMAKVKFSLLLLHLSSAWFDIYVTILSMPVFIFPITSGYALGLLYYLKVQPVVIAYFGFVSMFLLGPPILMSFENRYNHLVRQDPDSPNRKIKRGIHYFVNYFFSFTVFIPIFSTVLNPELSRKIAHEKLPCLPLNIIDNPRFVMLGTELYVVISCLLFYVVIIWSQILYFFIFTANFIFKTKSQSKRTSLLQKQFFKALCIQITVPLVIIMVPSSYIVYTIYSGNLDMMLSNFSMIWMSTHGLFSTVIMLMVHKPYREGTLEFLKLRKGIKMMNQTLRVFNRASSTVI